VRDIFWIKRDSPLALAIVLRPQGGRWLEMDLRRLRQEGIETLVSLLEEDEAAYLGLAEEGALAERNGIRFLSHSIPDANTPQAAASFQAFAAELADRLRAGEHIGVHCRGSIGRSSVTAACALIELGWKPEAALAAIEAARGCPVPETLEQEKWILRYKPRG
jgi:protein-tyrosine phosphatase